MTELSTTLERVRNALVPAFEADLQHAPSNSRAKRPTRWIAAAFAAVAVAGGAVAVADDWVGPSAPDDTQRLFFGAAWGKDIGPMGPVIEAARDERHVLYAAPANGGGYCVAVRDLSPAGVPGETSGAFCKTPARPQAGDINVFGSGDTPNADAAKYAACEDDPSPEAEQSCSYPPGVLVDFTDEYVIGQVNSDRATRIDVQLPNGLGTASATVGAGGLFIVDLPEGYGMLVKSGDYPGPAVAYDQDGHVVASSRFR